MSHSGHDPGGDALIGAWSLLSYEVYDERAPGDSPLGPSPRGTIIYTVDGHVSAHLMADRRGRCAVRLPFQCAPEEKIAAAESYVGYAGTYTFDGERVAHHVDISSFPNWTGVELRRQVAIHGDTMTLTSDDQVVAGRRRRAVLRWTRAGGRT